MVRVRKPTQLGSIPPTPPRKPALTFQRLLPILYKLCRISISGYSKAPRGLSVPSRVTCIFTGTMISPSLSLRQCPNRYAFRAGRNLPDKEFRYLRTVIVTAAVYWASIRSSSQPPLNLPAPGRRQPLYITLRFSRDLCFDKQSLGLFTAALRACTPKSTPSPEVTGSFCRVP